MKVLVTYYSETGNTELVAESIYDAVAKKTDAVLKEIKDIDLKELENYNLLFIGSPTHNTDLAEPVKGFLGALPEKPTFMMAGFYTHSCYPGNEGLDSAYRIEKFAGKCDATFEDISINKEINFIGHFRCSGKPSEDTAKYIRKNISKSDEDFENYKRVVMSHPDKKDLKIAKKFALGVLRKAKSQE